MLFAEDLISNHEDFHHPLRVVIIGTGFAERVQIPGFKFHPATEIVAVCSKQAERAKSTAEKHDIPAHYTDYRKMIETEKPDIVSVVTPPQLHLEMTLCAFQNGAHVLCEKPLAMNVAEAQQMLAAAQKYKRVHVINHEFRYLPARFYQKVLLDEGYVGTPLYLEATHLASWHLDPNLPWSWWSDASAGGGNWGALGSHYLDTFRWWLGVDVKEISCTLHIPFATRPDSAGNPQPVTADEGANVILEMTNGIKGIINLHSATAGDMRRLTIHGTEGALIVRNERELFGRKKDDKEAQPIEIPARYIPPAWNPDKNLLLGGFVRLMDLMVEKVLSRQLTDKNLQPANFVDGIAIQQALDAGRESHEKGQRISIKPIVETSQIQSDTESPATV